MSQIFFFSFFKVKVCNFSCRGSIAVSSVAPRRLTGADSRLSHNTIKCFVHNVPYKQVTLFSTSVPGRGRKQREGFKRNHHTKLNSWGCLWNNPERASSGLPGALPPPPSVNVLSYRKELWDSNGSKTFQRDEKLQDEIISLQEARRKLQSKLGEKVSIKSSVKWQVSVTIWFCSTVSV